MSRFTERHDAAMQDPVRARRFATELARIRAIDEVVNSLATQIEAAGVSKAEVARAIDVEPSTVSRLLTAETRNPTVGTVAEMAATVGYKLQLVPMSNAERVDTTALMRVSPGRRTRGAHRSRVAKPAEKATA